MHKSFTYKPPEVFDPFQSSVAPWAALKRVAWAFLLVFSRALTVLLLPPKSMIKVKLNSQLPLRTKHHPFPFLSLPEVTWISRDSVIKKNRVVQTAFPLLLLQASGRSSCSFAHLFLLSPISHQLLRISSFLGL